MEEAVHGIDFVPSRPHECTAQCRQGRRTGSRLGKEVPLRPATRDALRSRVLPVTRPLRATLVPTVWRTPHRLRRYLKMCTQYSTVPTQHTTQRQAQSRERMPRSLQSSLALSDSTPSVRLTDLAEYCAVTDCQTASPRPHSLAHWLRASIQLGSALRTPPLTSAVPDYVDLTLADRGLPSVGGSRR